MTTCAPGAVGEYARVNKAAKDFLTEAYLASQADMKVSLATATLNTRF